MKSLLRQASQGLDLPSLRSGLEYRLQIFFHSHVKLENALNTPNLSNKGFSGSSDGKESACNAGSIPGFRRSPGGYMSTHGSILAWRISWREEPGGLQFTESQRVKMTEQLTLLCCKGSHWNLTS